LSDFVTVTLALSDSLFLNSADFSLHDLDVLLEFRIVLFNHLVEDLVTGLVFLNHARKGASSVLLKFVTMVLVQLLLVPETSNISLFCINNPSEHVVGNNLGLNSLDLYFGESQGDLAI